MKKVIVLALALLMCISMVACAEKPSVEENTAGEPTVEPTVEPTEQPAEAENEVAELEDKIVIYSTHSESLLELVATEFTEQTGVEVEFINLKAELADRVRAEKNNPQADIMFGGASSIFMKLTEEDLFEAYLPTWGEALDPLFKDENNFWFGTIQTPVMMYYNTEMITAEAAPKDWADLGNEAYKDQLVFRNALSSSARAMYSSLLQYYEKNETLDAGWDLLDAIDENTKHYFTSDTLMFQAIGRQEAAVGFATLNSIMDNKVANNIPVEVVDAESGSPIITDGVALIKGAQHPNAAKAFIDYVGSAHTQALLAKEFNRLPTNPMVFTQSEIQVPEWMATVTVTPMDVDWADLSAKEAEWMQIWDTDIKNSEKDVNAE
jgi:iron(III) transport system substrate-binding protein